MQIFSIEDKKSFMTLLLTKDSFDKLLLSEARIEGRGHMVITGRPAPGFFSGEEMDKADPSGLLPYGLYRDTVFSFIKGDHTPSGLMIQLVLPRAETERIMETSGSSIPPGDVGSLSLIVRFKEGELTLGTGTSISGFYTEHLLEQGLEDYAASLLKRCGISFEKML